MSAVPETELTQGANPARPAESLVAGVRQAGVKRLIAVGGAGSLEVAPGVALVDAPGFPPS